MGSGRSGRLVDEDRSVDALDAVARPVGPIDPRLLGLGLGFRLELGLRLGLGLGLAGPPGPSIHAGQGQG